MEKVCYVTAFLDIGRGDWLLFKRGTNEYINKFKHNLYEYFRSMDKELAKSCELIVYLDSRYLNKLVIDCPNIRIVPIDKDFMNNMSVLWRRLDRETEIIKSETFKKTFPNRLNFPEQSKPEYTLINHAKIDFMIDAQQRTNSEYFCWIDFGYVNFPSNPIDINRLQKNKINYNLINPIDLRDRDIIYTVKYAPERIGGGFFFGSRSKLKEYQQLYHKTHLWFQNNNIVDDDQHIALRCYFKQPDLFYLHNFGGWFEHVKQFQKIRKKYKVISFCLWGDKPIYTKGLIQNVKLAKQIYPDWKCWVYLHTPTVPKEIIEELQTHDNVRIIPKEKVLIRPRRYMLWRFEPADDPNVYCFISRDTDSRITIRESSAVYEWINSGKRLHIMRDHPQHYPKILGGMHGVICDNVLQESKSLSTWEKDVDLFYENKPEETDDQLFLSDRIYPIYINDRMIHDEIKRYEGDECRPFPQKWGSDAHFIGCYVDENEKIDPETSLTLKRWIELNK